MFFRARSHRYSTSQPTTVQGTKKRPETVSTEAAGDGRTGRALIFGYDNSLERIASGQPGDVGGRFVGLDRFGRVRSVGTFCHASFLCATAQRKRAYQRQALSSTLARYFLMVNLVYDGSCDTSSSGLNQTPSSTSASSGEPEAWMRLKTPICFSSAYLNETCA